MRAIGRRSLLGHVDDEAVEHVFLHDSIKRLIDFGGADQFDIGLDVAGRAVVDHFLRLGDSTD